MTTDVTPVPADWSSLVNFLDSSPVTSHDIKYQSSIDPIISKVIKLCEVGWLPNFIAEPDLAPYSRRRDQLSLQNGCLLWGTRVVIPPKLRRSLLQELHSGHAGSTRMKELARSYMWWPNLDKDLEDVVKSCSVCLSQRPNPSKAELHPWEWPAHPWHRIHIDYAGPIQGKYFLILVDAHSKWVEVFPTSGPTSVETIKCLSHCFATFGYPVSIVSDNGPCFISREFQEFCKLRGIKHVTSAVYKPATNGLAERMVQTFKRSLRGSTSSVLATIDQFVFNYRLTPHSTTGVSPAELMFGRKMRSRLDLLWPTEQVACKVANSQRAQQRNHTQKPRRLDLSANSPILVRNYVPGATKWVPATVQEQTGPLSYKCSLSSGNTVKRHQDQIITASPSNESEVNTTLDPPEQHRSESSSASSLNIAASPTDTVVKSFVPAPRRSCRIRKPVEKLNL